MSEKALEIYLEKLAYFEADLAKTADTKQRFSIEHEIEEIKAKIFELGGQVPGPAKSVAAPDRLQWGITGIKPGALTPNVSRPTPHRVPNECRILFLASNPTAERLSLDEEVREIEAKIRAAEHRDTLKLISKWAVRPDDLLQALNQHQPHIVHFSGHGSPEEEIILQDSNGQPNPVSKRALAALFTTLKDNIRLVVLNACYSKPQAKAIVQVVDCVVGMNQAISDRAAIKFSASFYRALGFGRSVQESFDQGKTALMLEGIPEEETAELLLRDGIDGSEVILVGQP